MFLRPHDCLKKCFNALIRESSTSPRPGSVLMLPLYGGAPAEWFQNTRRAILLNDTEFCDV